MLENLLRMSRTQNENVYKFFVEEKLFGHKMLECVWDRTVVLTGMSRATGQRITTKKVE